MVMLRALVCGRVKDRPGVCSLALWRDLFGCKWRDKKAAAGSLMKSLDRRVSRVEERNQTPDIQASLGTPGTVD